ncbi:hypothetical protein [Microbacterium sp. MTN4-26]|uniref:hypothetical protein n=1 Tax=unclassified Microbacterium TaxID=2609290 RepID=UPI0036F1B0CA
MTTASEPIRWDRMVYVGTDHEWTQRRVDAEGSPIIPTEAQAQLRNRHGGTLWTECITEIDDVDGWVTVRIPASATATDAWSKRERGVWDLEVVVGGKRLRWAEGAVTVSQEVTK